MAGSHLKTLSSKKLFPRSLPPRNVHGIHHEFSVCMSTRYGLLVNPMYWIRVFVLESSSDWPCALLLAGTPIYTFFYSLSMSVALNASNRLF